MRDFCRSTIPFICNINLFQLLRICYAFSPRAVPTRGRAFRGCREFETALSKIHDFFLFEGWLGRYEIFVGTEWDRVGCFSIKAEIKKVDKDR